MDLQASGNPASVAAAAEKAQKMRFALIRARWNTRCRLRVGRSDGRTFAATWTGEKGQEINTRLTPRGQFLDASPGDGELTPWRWALLGEVVLAPLDPEAQSGDRWTSLAFALLAHLQLHPAPIVRQATASFQMEDCVTFRGRPYFVVTKVVRMDLRGVESQELVDREYADYFG
ncbi:MAG: hypothetical protein U9N87_10825, partial [Planctomycetota bacterium]|nr:hypothetical protein [Planctomycetota bacterium]